MTRDEILKNPEYLTGQIIKYVHRRKDGDLEKAKFYLDKLIELEAQDDEAFEIDLLTEFKDALLGAVFDSGGNPIPCYDSVAVIDQLTAQGLSEDEAVDYAERVADGMRIIWVDEIELQDGGRWLEECQEEAQQAPKGLWADDDPMPPWEWRRK